MTLEQLAPGMQVAWLHEPRGGYGFTTPVDAIVLKICKRRVQIEVLLRDGRRVARVVSPDFLRPSASGHKELTRCRRSLG